MHACDFIQTLFFIILLNFLEDIMEVNYQKTIQLDTDVHSFKEYFGLLSLSFIPSKRIFFLIFKLIKGVLFKKLDELSNLFKENQDIFPYEYYDCLEINDMIKYTLKREPSSIKPKDLKFVRDVSDSFFDITSTKLELIKNNNCIIDENFYNVFNHEYDSFNAKLLNFKEYFYRNIYQESYDEQDVIDYLEIVWE